MRICVIGAGASGLVAAKKLLDQGLDPQVYERNAELGGNWLYGSPGSSVYRSTYLISSKRLTELRDFPLPAEWPPYISHEQALEYFRRYAARFHLRPHIRFGVEVRRCERDEEGCWRVETPQGSERFDALVVASGHHRINSQLYYAIGHGKVTPKPDVARLAGNRVAFTDGSEEEADAIVCATGFQLSVPFLDDRYLNLRDGRPVFYKNVFHPHIDNLFLIGFIQPNSGGWFLAELQAELVARALRHPSKRLRAAIADRQETHYFDYLPSPRHHLEVDYLRYERDLRRLLRRTAGRKEAA